EPTWPSPPTGRSSHRQMVPSGQLHRRGGALGAGSDVHQILGADGSRKRKQLTIHEAASCPLRAVLRADEVLNFLQARPIKLRLIARDGLNLLGERLGDIHHKCGLETSLLGIKWKWSINQVRHSIRGDIGKTI